MSKKRRVFGGIYFAIFEPHLFYRTEEVLIGVGLWGFAFAFTWFAYGKEFWIAANKLEEHRANEIMESVMN